MTSLVRLVALTWSVKVEDLSPSRSLFQQNERQSTIQQEQQQIAQKQRL